LEQFHFSDKRVNQDFPDRVQKAARPAVPAPITLVRTLRDGSARRMRLNDSKNINAWDMGPRWAGAHSRKLLGAGRFLSPIGRRENFGYKSLQRRGSGVLWGAWLEGL
jgi:hypothetical protein